ncbi:MAG: hypothetical protein ACYCVY_11690 [Acidiferrobacteraceae bacterium]
MAQGAAQGERRRGFRQPKPVGPRALRDADVVFESCPIRILLPNPEAMTETSRPFYGQIGRNSCQLEILATAVPKRQDYLTPPAGRRLLELGLSAPELAFLGASGPEDLARVRALRATYGDAWPARWLRECGEGAWAECWEGDGSVQEIPKSVTDGGAGVW